MKLSISSRGIITLILLIFAMNAANVESRTILVLFVLQFILGYRKIVVNRGTIYLALFSISFYSLSVLYHPEMLTFYILPYLLAPILGYIIGSNYMQSSTRESVDYLLHACFFTIVGGRFLHGLFNFVISKGYQNYTRNGIDFWTRTVLSATGQGALMTLAGSLLFYGTFLISFKEKPIEKTVVLFMVACALANYLLSATRGGLFIGITVFMLESFLFIFIEKIDKKKKMQVLACLFILIIIGMCVFFTDMFGVRDAFYTSALYQRLGHQNDISTSNTGRIQMLIRVIPNAFCHPFGDGSLNTAHNLWLDILKQTGWLPFLCLILFTIYCSKLIFEVVRMEKQKKENKYFILAVFLSACLNFAIEPIMKGMPYFFAGFCIMMGALDSYITKIRLPNN